MCDIFFQNACGRCLLIFFYYKPDKIFTHKNIKGLFKFEKLYMSHLVNIKL